jgi:hypothetical protein
MAPRNGDADTSRNLGGSLALEVRVGECMSDLLNAGAPILVGAIRLDRHELPSRADRIPSSIRFGRFA